LDILTPTIPERTQLHDYRQIERTVFALRAGFANPSQSRHTQTPNRVHWYLWDCPFATGAFPPCLTATQFPLAPPPFTGSMRLNFN
jgi:hypothetical protein